MNRINSPADILTIALMKGGEKYIVIFDAPNVDEALRTIGRWASDPEISFT